MCQRGFATQQEQAYITPQCIDVADAQLQAGGAAEQRLEGHTDTVASLAFSSDGSKLASGGLDGEAASSIMLAAYVIESVAPASWLG